jgi:hypothetical protein
VRVERVALNFSTAGKILSVIRAGDTVQAVRGANRSKILSASNCMPPLDDERCKKMGIKINVDFGEFLEVTSEATGQLVNAFNSNQYLFEVKIPSAPVEHADDWEAFITQQINRPLRKSRELFELSRSRWSSVILYGIAAMTWPDQERWLPRFRSLADLRIATDTTLDFRNLNWFAAREMYTPMELLDEVFNDKPNNRWDQKAIARILKNYKEWNFNEASQNYDIETDPEKFIGLVKQNGGFYASDALPAIPMWHFYFQDEGAWHLRVVPETGTVKDSGEADKFMWPKDSATNKTPIAKSWKNILHCQYGNLTGNPDAKFHEVRGMGFIMLEPIFYKNLLRCRVLQHANDNLNIWLKSSDNAEKARGQIQEFANLGVLKQGLSIVPQTERHQIDHELIESVMAELQQLKSTASSAYTQQQDTGTAKEQTAFETRVKMEQVSSKMTSILSTAFKYETYAYEEICRRFCIKNSSDPDVAVFRTRCLSYGIPADFLDVKHWDVEPVTPMGAGNPTIAMSTVQLLQQLAPKLNPTAQNEINHETLLVYTKDWRKAQRWAPLSGKPSESDAKREMVGYFAALMEGSQIPLSQANLIDQCEALLPLYAQKIANITKRNNMATQDEAAGLQGVSSYLGEAIKQLSQDQSQKARVKQFEEIKARQDNLARALIQRGAAQQKKLAQQNGNGKLQEMQQKMQLDKAKAQQDMQIRGAKAKQDMAIKGMEFLQHQRHETADLLLGHKRENFATAAEVGREGFKALADAHHKRLAALSNDDESEAE